MEKRKIVDYHDLRADVESSAGEDLLKHLESNILGTPGGLRYKHTRTREKLENLGEVYFLLLRKGTRMLGSVGLCYRLTRNSGNEYTSWYVRYFAIKAPLKSSRPRAEKLLERSGAGLSLLRKVSAPYLTTPGEKLKNLPAGTEKSLVYAYIENGNFQSNQFALQNGFETIRKLTTFVFSSFFPSTSKNVSQIREEEKEEVRIKLQKFYDDHTLYMEDYLFFKNNYLVFREGNRIVAGMQANPDMWKVVDMKGISGKFLVKVLPFIPGLNRIFNPRRLRFVATDYIFWEPGYEHTLNALFELACAINKLGLLMVWPDTAGILIQTLDKKVHQGLVGKINKRVEVDIKVKFNGYKEEEKMVFYRNPSFISSFDLT